MSFYEELKRRNVFRVGVAYVLLGWALLQGADFTLDLIGAPDWTIRALAVVVGVGLPIALFFAWAFELTPEGIKRESEVDRSGSVTPQTGRRLDRMIILFLVLVIAVMGLERFSEDDTAANTVVESATTTPAAASRAGASSVKSIAVLPFVNMSADPENEYFSDGVSEEILNVLAGIPELKVASRTSAFRFKGRELGIDEIAATLGVNHVLEGSVRKAGNQVRITAQLIHAEDGFHLWSETYDRELDNIFVIQDEIAGSIAEVLQVQLLGESRGYTTVQDLTPAGYEDFLKARFLMRQRNEAAMQEAEALTRQLLEDYPDFPVGLTQLAEIRIQNRDYRDEDASVEVQALTDQAIALEPDLPAAHMLLGQLAMDDGRPLDSIRHLERAIALDPAEPRPHHWLGIVLGNSGYLERARDELQIAVDLEPDHANANGYLGFMLMLLGDYERAMAQFETQERLGNPFGGQRKVQVAILNGDLGLARALIEEREEVSAAEAERLRLFATAMEDAGAQGAYLAFIDQRDVSEIGIDEWHVALELLALGQYERALDFNLGGYPRLAWAERWRAARALPAFDRKVKEAGLPAVWGALGPPPACRKVANGYDCANGDSP